jgi:YD repeat-containing protein
MGDTYLVATYNAAGQLVNTTDSAQNAASTTAYSYDASGRLVTIATSSRSDNVTTSEIHLYTYDANGHPASLLRIRDQHDTTAVQFVLDENGNIAEERATRKNQAQPTIFYYYDTQHRLTDVVRFNVKAQRLLPDYIFEYTENGLLKKMLVVPSGTNEYQTWYYQYEPGGLKKLDLCYNKAQQLVGKVVYEYSR